MPAVQEFDGKQYQQDREVGERGPRGRDKPHVEIETQHDGGKGEGPCAMAVRRERQQQRRHDEQAQREFVALVDVVPDRDAGHRPPARPSSRRSMSAMTIPSAGHRTPGTRTTPNARARSVRSDRAEAERPAASSRARRPECRPASCPRSRTGPPSPIRGGPAAGSWPARATTRKTPANRIVGTNHDQPQHHENRKPPSWTMAAKRRPAPGKDRHTEARTGIAATSRSVRKFPAVRRERLALTSHACHGIMIGKEEARCRRTRPQRGRQGFRQLI